MKNFKRLINDANKEIKRLYDFLNENEGLYKYRNLKLYDACFNEDLQEKYNLSDNEYSDLFYMFCESSYEHFTQWLKDENIVDTRKYLGLTSNFDLCNDIIDMNRQYDYINIDMTLYNICYNNYGSNDIDEIIDHESDKVTIDLITKYCKHGNKEYLKGNIEDLKKCLEYIASGDMYNDFMIDMEDSIKINKYLNDFMENQIEYFDEFLHMQLEE